MEVIRAFPDVRAVALDVNHWQDLICSLVALGPVRVLVSNGAATVEVVGRFGGFSTTGEFFNVQTESLDMHIRWQELAAAFAVEKQGHMDGLSTCSIQFFDRQSSAAFKIFLNFGEPISAERLHTFNQPKERFPWIFRGPSV